MLALWTDSLQIPKDNEHVFNDIALSTFHYQYRNNQIYREFVALSKYSPDDIVHYSQIPFLPISFFKTHLLLTQRVPDTNALLRFESSGTTGTNTSKHYVLDPGIYEESFLRAFKLFYGDPDQYVFYCLLPSYLEREHSSLVYMCRRLIRESAHPDSGFFLNDQPGLADLLRRKEGTGRKIFLLGVTFGLLDFAEKYHDLNLGDAIVMETGGMKGRREEWTREQIHDFLQDTWNLPKIHSEYGMTELLSQAYAENSGIYRTPPWMKILVRDINDPKATTTHGSGLINVIDLANIYSCSFIATDDIGKVNMDGSFGVLGRNDHSILRGCSMLAV